MRSILLVALVALPSGVATADSDLAFDPLTMDRLTPTTTFGVDLGYEVWDTNGDDDVTVIGLNVGGHWVTPQGIGGYLSVPLSYLSFQTAGNDDSEMALGNVEVGGVLAKPITNGAVMFHAGIALPTAGDGDNLGSLQVLASIPRWGDVVQRIPDSTWLRIGVSPMGRSGGLFWRADVGVDIALDGDRNDISPMFRVNLGGGLDLGTAQLLAELVTNIIDDSDSNDDSSSTLTFGARFASGNLRPGIGLLFPVGFNGLEDNLDFAVIASLAAHVAR